MSLIRKHGAVLQAWACLALVWHCNSSFGIQKKLRVSIYVLWRSQHWSNV